MILGVRYIPLYWALNSNDKKKEKKTLILDFFGILKMHKPQWLQTITITAMHCFSEPTMLPSITTLLDHESKDLSLFDFPHSMEMKTSFSVYYYFYIKIGRIISICRDLDIPPYSGLTKTLLQLT